MVQRYCVDCEHLTEADEKIILAYPVHIYVSNIDYATLEREKADLAEIIAYKDKMYLTATERIDELFDQKQELAEKVKELGYTISEQKMLINLYENLDNGRIKELEAENAELRKRLEPIQEWWKEYDNGTEYPVFPMSLWYAIEKCMEMASKTDEK